METVDIAVVGAGPYGLAVAAHLKAAGKEARTFGRPLHFWATQTPEAMVLRSPYRGSDIGSRPALSLDDYANASGLPISTPIPVERFIEYGQWFQERAVPDLDTRDVEGVEKTDDGFRVTVEGETYAARRVVVAAGVGTFASKPKMFDGFEGELVSHTLDHHKLSGFAGKRVTVIGGGQSALESGALLHEQGADVDVVARAQEVRWLSEGSWKHTTWPVNRLLYAPPDVGPAFVSQIVARPDAYRRMSRSLQDRLAVRSVRPAGAGWLRPRLRDVPIRTGLETVHVERDGDRVQLQFNDASEQTVDHVMLGTGYRVDLSRYGFLAPKLVRAITCVNGYPRLADGFETSVPGLHIVGAPAAWSFGPLMRFVAGSGFAARELTRRLS